MIFLKFYLALVSNQRCPGPACYVLMSNKWTSMYLAIQSNFRNIAEGQED